MDSRSRQQIVALALGMVLTLALAYVAVAMASQSQWWCERKDDRKLAAMEKRVDAELGKKPHTFLRYSACEETGRPGAALSVEIEGWNSRRVVTQEFRTRGWIQGDGELYSADGAYRLRIVVSWEGDRVARHLYATVTSAEAEPESD